jgi:CHAD domain-containing protein
MHEYDQEAIHDYRVAVKRIRAIFRAMNNIYTEPVFPNELIYPLRVMFKAGGTIRDDQVQIELVEGLEKANDFAFPLIKAFYSKRIEDQRTEFFLKSVDFNYFLVDEIAKDIESVVEPLDDEYLESQLYKRLYQSMEKLKIKRYDIISPALLHKFRTKIKENSYLAEMMSQSVYSSKVSKSTYNRLKVFGQELGDWHDHYQLWTKTAFIFQESKDADLMEEAFLLRKYITPVHDKLFQEITHMIKRDDSLFAI